MRKILFLLFLSLLLTTGCTKRLQCTKTDDESMITTKENFIVRYQNEKVSTIQIDLIATLQKGYEDSAEDVKNNLKEQFEKYENMKGISLRSANHDNIVRIELYIELDKMREKDKKQLNFVNLDENYDTLKKTMEKNKYQCS